MCDKKLGISLMNELENRPKKTIGKNVGFFQSSDSCRVALAAGRQEAWVERKR